MPLISESVTDLYGGVSQAPPASRAQNQFTELVNSLPIFGKRLGRRMPFTYVAKLGTAVLTSATSYVHSVLTSTGLRVHLVFSNGTVTAFDAATGASIAVVSPDGTAYASPLAGSPLRAATNGDTTIVVNPQVAVRRGSTTAREARHEALIYVKQGTYSTIYTITVDAVTVSYTSPDSGTVGASAAIATNVICGTLVSLLAPALPNFYVGSFGSSLYLTKVDGTDFKVTSQDGLADKGMLVIKDTVLRASDLPDRARPGFLVTVTGTDPSVSPYYLRYSSGATRFVPGVWKEVSKPSSFTSLDGTTLPFQCTFRGSYIPETPQLALASLMPEAIPSPTLAYDWSVLFPADQMYPANTPITLTLAPIGAYTYTTGAASETPTQVVAGFIAVIGADPLWTVTRRGPELLGIVNVAHTTFTPTATVGYDPATVFTTLTTLRTGLVGLTMKNLTDGSSGVITASTRSAVTVSSLTGGVTNRFNDGDVCVVVGNGDYFMFSQAPWKVRLVGDDTTVPFPSFVGKALTEVGFHQGRLILVAGTGLVLSRSGDLFNLFRQSATQVLSSDPIDVKNATGDSSPFHSAVPWNGSLYLFSTQRQYEVGADNTGVITPLNIRLRAVSRYFNDSRVRPVAAGNRLYFVAMKSGYTRVLEYRIKGYEQLHDAQDTGLHLPTYFQGNPVALAVDETQGTLLLLTDGLLRRSVYVYSYRFEDGEKVVAGWHRWDTSGGSILSLDCTDGKVGMIRACGDGTFLESMALDPQALASYDSYFNGGSLFDGSIVFGQGTPGGLERAAYLDRRVTRTTTGVSVAYSGGVTTWTLPYMVATDGSEGTLVVVTESGPTRLVTTRPAANKIAAVGDYSGASVYIGVLYTTAWTLSTLYLRTKEGKADERGRLQVRFLRLRYADSTDLSASVAIAGRAASVTTLSVARPQSSTLVVPVQGKNEDVTITVSNATPGAGHLTAFDWEGTHHTREQSL